MPSCRNTTAWSSPKSFSTGIFASSRANEKELEMSDRFLASLGVVAAMIAAGLLAAASAASQAQSTNATAWTLPRMPDGRPDLQGVWDYRTITPLERPKELG